MTDLIEAISRGCKGTLADGTVRYTIDIEPRYAADAAKLFGMPGTSVVLAVLSPEAAKKSAQDETISQEKPKGGDLARWAGILCNAPMFWDWLSEYDTPVTNSEDARFAICDICGIDSRAQLDHNHVAGEIFRREIMANFDAWKSNK